MKRGWQPTKCPDGGSDLFAVGGSVLLRCKEGMPGQSWARSAQSEPGKQKRGETQRGWVNKENQKDVPNVNDKRK